MCKMFSLPFWKVFFFIALQGFSILAGEDTLLDVDKSRDLIKVKCHLLYGAYVHIYYAKTVYFHTSFNDINFTQLEDISFEDEATKMIKLLFIVDKMQMDEFWLIYMYTYKINKFFEAKIKEEGLTSDDIENTLIMHNFVITAIKNFFKAKDCQLNDISFKANNDSSTNCENPKYLPDSFHINKKIIDNKTWINKLIESEKKQDPSTDYDIIPLLYFSARRHMNFDNHLVNFQEFLKVPGQQDDWDNAFKNIEEIKNQTHSAGLKGIRYLGIYHSSITVMLTVIMIRLTWRYIIALPQYTFAINKKFIKMLERFQYQMILEKDIIFLKLKHFITKFRLFFNKRFIAEHIKQLISSLPVVPDCHFVERVPTEKSDTVLKITGKFIDKISNTMGGRDTFSLSKSFVQMFQNLVPIFVMD